MSAVDDRVHAQNFTTLTDLTPEEIRKAGLRAIEVSKRAMTSAVHEDQVRDNAISYKIKGPGGLVTQLAFEVTWDNAEAGQRQISLRVGNYTTARTMVMFIPITPKRVPALGSLERFSAQLRHDLGAEVQTA